MSSEVDGQIKILVHIDTSRVGRTTSSQQTTAIHAAYCVNVWQIHNDDIKKVELLKHDKKSVIIETHNHDRNKQQDGVIRALQKKEVH